MLIALALVLAAAFGVFLTRGLGQLERLRTAHAELGERREALTERSLSVDLVPFEEFAALSQRRARAVALVARRRQALSDQTIAAPDDDLEALLSGSGLPALRAPSALADALRRQAAQGVHAQAALVALLGALPEDGGFDLESLELQDEGRTQPVAGLDDLREVRAQLVVVGAPESVLGCLETLAVDRGRGLPAPTVLTASVRRIEPERWGASLHALEAPPVRLSVNVAILLPWSAREGG
jgi:hypothetical protein